MKENENSTVQNTEQPVTTVNEPLQTAAPVAQATPVDPVAPTSPAPANVFPEPVSAPKAKSKLPLIIIAVILILGIAGAVYYFFFMKVTATQVVNGTINKIFAAADKAATKIDDVFVVDYKTDVVKTTGYLKVSVDSNDPTALAQLGGLKNATAKYEFLVDAKNLEGNLDLSYIENDSTIVTLNALLSNKTAYVKSDALTDVYKLDLANAIDWSQLDVSKLPAYDSRIFTKSLKSIKEYVKKAIKDEYVTQTSGSFTVDGSTLSGLKTTITIDEKRASEMLVSILESIKNDESSDSLLSIASQYGVTKEELLNDINEAVEREKRRTSFDENSKMIINIYTKNQGKFIGMEFLINDEKMTTVTSSGSDYTIKLYSAGKEVVKLNYNENSRELSWTNETNTQKIVVTFKDDGFKAVFTMEGVTVSLEYISKTNKQKVDETLKLEGKLSQGGSEISGAAEINGTLEKATSINKFDTSNAKDVTTLTEAELSAIELSFESKLASSKAYTLAKLMFGSLYNTNNYTYNINYNDPYGYSYN